MQQVRKRINAAYKVVPHYDKQGYDVALFEPNAGLFGIFDGMGVSEDSRFASATAAETVKQRKPRNWSDLTAALQQAIKDVSVRRSAGTTATIALIDNYIHYAHIGDSRLYVLSDGRIKQVTADEGVGNLLLNYVGSHSNGINQAGTVMNWERCMIVSDGITGDWEHQLIPDQVIEGILKEGATPQIVIDEMLAASIKVDDKSIIVAFKEEVND